MSDENKRTLNDIVDAYADGELSSEDMQGLLAAIKSEPEARERLAVITVIERMLRAPSLPATTGKTVVGALPKADTKAAAKLREGKGESRKSKKKLVFKTEKPGAKRIRERKRKVWNKAKSSHNGVPAVFVVCLFLFLAMGIGLWQRGDRTEGRGQKAEGRGQKAEGRGQTTEGRVPKAEGRGQKAEGENGEPKVVSTSKPPKEAQPATISLAPVDPDEGFISPPEGLMKYGTDDLPPSRLKDTPSGAVQQLLHAVQRSAPESPMLISKLKRGRREQWNATPNDVDNLLRELELVTGLKYDASEKTMDETMMASDSLPIIYFTTHYKFEFTDSERKQLRNYMLSGGTVLFNTGLGSLPAYRSAIRELKLIFPDSPPHPLNSDHPVFRSYFNIAQVRYGALSQAAKDSGSSPRFDGVTRNCRLMALVSRWGMAIGWEGAERAGHNAYLSEYARKMGVNIISYSIAQRAWIRQMDERVTATAPASSPGKLYIAQVKYDGEWKTRGRGLSVLLNTFNRKTDVPVKPGIKELSLTDPKVFNAPLLYITGHGDFYLTNKEARQLKKYFLSGGMLFAEACCGREGFDKAFRAEIERILDGKTLEMIPSDSTIYSQPNKIGKIGITSSLSAKLGDIQHRPVLEGIELDGHYAVIYSRYGLAGGWEMSQNPYADGYSDIGSLHLGQNILFYAITQ